MTQLKKSGCSGWLLALTALFGAMAIFALLSSQHVLSLLCMVIAAAAHGFWNHLAFRAKSAELAAQEEALRQSEESTRGIVNTALDAVITMDSAGRIQAWSPQAAATFGWSKEEAVGRPLAETIVPPRYQEAHVRGLQKFLETGEGPVLGKRIEITARHRDGHELPVELAICLTRQGDACIFNAFVRDITDRKSAEDVWRNATEAAVRAKSEFLANMSHEIRTPMNAVIGMTSLLLDTELTPEQIDYAETVRQSGESLLTIINDILEFSKIESGKMELEQQPCCLRDVVEDSLDLLAGKAAEKQLDLAYLLESNVPGAVVGDVTRMRQILVNLLSNAVKFTKKGEVVVTVTSQPVQGKESAHEVHFAVKDSGIGIPADRMGRLFQSFSQVDTSSTRHYGGTGLGLAISKRLSEIMGGTMWVESEPGKGSTFHFRIVAESAPSKPRIYLQGTEPILAGKRLLIVEDNATNRRIIETQAESWGMLARSTSSCSEAIAWIRQGDPFDAGILDMQMPEMSGQDLATQIRTLRDDLSMPLVMLTSPGLKSMAAAAAFVATYLTKPIKPSQLYDVLLGVFGGANARIHAARLLEQVDSRLAQKLPLRILIAEDNTVNQKVAARILQRMGYRADVVGNGIEVLDAVRRQRYDLVLMDLQMPDMDGLEATRRICAEMPVGKRPHLVAMSTNAAEENRDICLSSGMNGYVLKPLKSEDLQAAILKCATTPK